MSEAELTEALKKAISECELSLNQLAANCGVSVPQLSRFVSGERGLTLDTAEKLFHYFGMKVQLPARKPGKKK